MKGVSDMAAGGLVSGALRFYRKQALVNRGRGLTTKGKRYVRNLKRLRDPALAVAARSANWRRWRERSMRFVAAGLNTRGEPRRYRLKSADGFVLVREFDALAAELNGCFDALPDGRARAAVLRVGMLMGDMRRRLDVI